MGILILKKENLISQFEECKKVLNSEAEISIVNVIDRKNLNFCLGTSEAEASNW